VKATVVVVDWRRPELTRRCLRSLEQQDSSPFEVVLVVNEAEPGFLAEIAGEFPQVVLVPEMENTGFAAAVQAGVDRSSGDVVVLLNNDAVATPGFVREVVEALGRAGEDVAAVAPLVLLEGTFDEGGSPDDPDSLLSGDGVRWSRRADEGGASLVNSTGIEVTRDGNGSDRDWLRPVEDLAAPGRGAEPFGFSGGAAAIRREALDAVGGFDPSLFMYYEDLDVSWRLRLAGLRVVLAPDAVVVHRHAGSSSSSGSLVRYQSMRNRLAVVVRNGSPRFVVRVVARTAARAARDLVSGERGQLEASAWRRLAGELPGMVVVALRHRRRDGRTGADRRRVERLFSER
jgi:N-acetylglucosaminyl-diphospho-decaprenol L-rhamnosyltransferase